MSLAVLNQMFMGVVASFAIWRFSRFIRKEPGPKNIMGWVRHKVGSDQPFPKDGSLADGMSCNKCLGFWLCVICTVCWYLADPSFYSPVVWVMLPFALSAMTMVYEALDGPAQHYCMIHEHEHSALKEKLKAEHLSHLAKVGSALGEVSRVDPRFKIDRDAINDDLQRNKGGSWRGDPQLSPERLDGGIQFDEIQMSHSGPILNTTKGEWVDPIESEPYPSSDLSELRQSLKKEESPAPK